MLYNEITIVVILERKLTKTDSSLSVCFLPWKDLKAMNEPQSGGTASERKKKNVKSKQHGTLERCGFSLKHGSNFTEHKNERKTGRQVQEMHSCHKKDARGGQGSLFVGQSYENVFLKIPLSHDC